MNWRLKLSNLLTGNALNKYQRQAELAKSKLQQTESELASLKIQLQQSQKELQQTSAQLQINQGFQVELGETQFKLKKTQTQLEQCQTRFQQQRKQIQKFQTQLQQTHNKLASSQDWVQLVQTPIQILEVKRLPLEDFDALWGFGISSPAPESKTIGGSIIVKGWVLGKKSLATKVRINFQEEVLIETTVEQPRPTITQYYPDIPAAANSGFETPLSVTAMDSEAELEVQVILEDESIIPLCVIILKR